MSGPNRSRRRLTPPMAYGWMWPGLPQLWLGGEWVGLSWAGLFAVALNVQLLTTLVYQELLSPTADYAGWLIVGGFWIAGIAVGRRWIKKHARTAESAKIEQSLFAEAFHNYLQADWIGAETKCRELIKRRRGDVDARLLLATVMRHAGRLDEARQQLDALDKIEGSEKWGMEIATERRHLDELQDIANNSGNREAENSADDADETAETIRFPEQAGGGAIRNAA